MRPRETARATASGGPDSRRWWLVLALIAVSQFGFVLLGYWLTRPVVPLAQVGAFDTLIWSYLAAVVVMLGFIARGSRWGGRLFVALLIIDWLQPLYDLGIFRVTAGTLLWLLLAATNTVLLGAVRRETGIMAPGAWLRRWWQRLRRSPKAG